MSLAGQQNDTVIGSDRINDMDTMQPLLSMFDELRDTADEQ